MPAEYESGVHDQPAWHRLGTVLNAKFNTAQALRAGGLDWDVVKEPVVRKGEEVPERFFTVRQQDDHVLGIVGRVYTPVQNRDAFQFVDDLLGSRGGFHFTQAVSLRRGAVVALTAKAPFPVTLPTSKGELYVVLFNTHDGSGALTAMATPVQVVCMNTLRSALSAKEACVRLRHTTLVNERIANVRDVLGLSQGVADLMATRAEELYRKRLTAKRFERFLEDLVPVAPEAAAGGVTRAQNMRTTISEIYHGPDFGQPDMAGTAWGAYNACVVLNDHVQGARKTKSSTEAENLFMRIMNGENIGSRAMELLLA